ncbi:Rieske (2Fe-2S) protein [Reyranella sp.]|jgi:nitrite reductase/ring-hydroxylating ferredoxin subunit|uniref:Rieske (2Fe-2S) protein n=1 Tax=Reyranella sp. TaxID=1929291 RepID=UPI003D0D608C
MRGAIRQPGHDGGDLIRMRSFFDPTLIERNGVAFIREDQIDNALGRLIPNVHITKGRYVHPAHAELRDLAWNHMDQNHRPFIHRTYSDAMRVHIGEEAAFSLTRFGKWPMVVPVFDGHYKDNGFYQVVCLFGLFVVINFIAARADGQRTYMEIDWAIASHRLLRFLHPALDRRLRRLNEVQNVEDEGVRDRRVALRADGYRFQTDNPDFVNSNVVSNNVIFPPVLMPQAVSLADLRDGEVRRIDVDRRAYLVRRAGEAVQVWPAICPHEGAAIGPEHVRANGVKCPWHGLEFGMRLLRPGSPGVTMCGARVEFKDASLIVGAAPG